MTGAAITTQCAVSRRGLTPRNHPHGQARRAIPIWTGHSIGRWDGDTLIVDAVGLNDKCWFDRRGTPHTEQLHTIERYTRLNYGTLVNRVTLEDPGGCAGL